MNRMKNFSPQFAAICLIVLLAGCAANRPAPVVDSRPGVPTALPIAPLPPVVAPVDVSTPSPGDKVHVIQKGDTLISIALANGLDYRELAMWNNIENPNVIKLGESIRLTPPGVTVAGPSAVGEQPKPGEPVATPLIFSPVVTPGTALGNTDKLKTEPKAGRVPYSDAAYAKLLAEATAAGAVATTVLPATTAPPVGVVPTPLPVTRNDDVEWSWPIQPQPRGRIIAMFTDANKGIDISGAKDSPVLAAGPGKVVYSGAGLRGYGRLVIVKHNDTWLSAYAHNDKILVNEGQEVKKGQKIAEMGSSDADQVKLHFEIRKQGKPVDPLKFLPN